MLAALQAALARKGGTSLSDFLGAYGEVAAGMLTAKQSETERLVAARIVTASQRFADRWDGPLGFATAEILHLSYWVDPEFVRYDCPACRTDAALGGVVDVQEHVDFDREGNPSVDLEPILWPDHFLCRACGLELNGPDEISASGLTFEDGLPLEGDDVQAAIDAYLSDAYSDLYDDEYR